MGAFICSWLRSVFSGIFYDLLACLRVMSYEPKMAAMRIQLPPANRMRHGLLLLRMNDKASYHPTARISDTNWTRSIGSRSRPAMLGILTRVSEDGFAEMATTSLQILDTVLHPLICLTSAWHPLKSCAIDRLPRCNITLLINTSFTSQGAFVGHRK